MENKLEQLLNSLVEKGWKPFGYNTIDNILIEGDNYKFISKGCYSFITNIRLLVSKESGLWQFVCDNKMEKKMEKNHRGIWINSWAKSAYQSYPVYTMERYKYRIIESALKDKNELEDFLLNNINADE